MREFKHYFGTYRGFSVMSGFSTESGEVEISIDSHLIKIRTATGISIEEEVVPMNSIRKLSEEEVQSHYVHRDSERYKRVDGFRAGGDGVTFLFCREPDIGEPMLLVLPGEFIGMLCFGPEQIADGAFDKMIKEIIEEEGENVFPRLTYGGKVQP